VATVGPAIVGGSGGRLLGRLLVRKPRVAFVPSRPPTHYAVTAQDSRHYADLATAIVSWDDDEDAIALLLTI